MLLIGSYSDVSIFICEVVVFYFMTFRVVSLLHMFYILTIIFGARSFSCHTYLGCLDRQFFLQIWGISLSRLFVPLIFVSVPSRPCILKSGALIISQSC